MEVALIYLFFEKHDGGVISTTIPKYMYLLMHTYFYKDKIILKYSETEFVSDYSEIKHKYFKQCLSDFMVNGVVISSMADISVGTGLGSSSAFAIALLHLLHAYKGEHVSKCKLTKDACEVGLDKLGKLFNSLNKRSKSKL